MAIYNIEPRNLYNRLDMVNKVKINRLEWSHIKETQDERP
jgi:hypothetical protein